MIRCARLVFWALAALVYFVLAVMFSKTEGLLGRMLMFMMGVCGFVCLVLLGLLVWLISQGGIAPFHDFVMLLLSIVMFAAPAGLLAVWTCKRRAAQ